MTAEATEGVNQIKKSAEKGCNLYHLNYGKKIFVAADTSLHGIGGCVGNFDELDEKNKILENIQIAAYTSRALDAKEALLSSRARELIGLAFVLENLEDLIPRDLEVTLITDHLSLGTLFDKNANEGKTSFHTRVRRAISVLFEFNLKLIYFPGESDLIKVVDGLSRSAKYISTPLKIFESELNLKIELVKNKEMNSFELIDDLPTIPTAPLLTKQIILAA